MPNVKLETSDKKIIEVDVEVAKVSGMLKNMIEAISTENGEDVIQLPNVNARILKKVIEWATFHVDDHPALLLEGFEDRRTNNIPLWDMEFLEVDVDTLLKISLAANYLEIKRLGTLTCKTIANLIKGRTTEQIRKTFELENDFKRIQEKKVKEEMDWHSDTSTDSDDDRHRRDLRYF